MKNELKARIKKILLEKYDAETVAKGMGRAERWIKAAYGNSGVEGYKTRLEECTDFDDMVAFFVPYCDEIGTGESYNAEALSEGKARFLFKRIKNSPR